MGFRIVNSGMGGLLNPPGDAEHNWSIQTFGRHGNGDEYSLRYALKSDYIPEHIKQQIRDLFAANPPQLTEEWVRDCYKYFKNCYSPDGKQRLISKLVREGPPEYHAAHLHIVQFFPDYQPRLDLL